MKQNHFARKKRQLKILAEKLQHLLLYHSGDASYQIKKLVLKIKKLILELTHVLSHADLKKILGVTAILFGISLTNQSTAQSFAPPIENPFGLVSTPFYNWPAFTDLDGDGDQDLLVGAGTGTIQYFENIGDSLNPQFAAPQENPFGLVSYFYRSRPAFTDLDGDSDTDLLLGDYDGNLLYCENIGDSINPQFAAPQENPFGLDSIYRRASPAFANLDGDGDQDLLVGMYYGVMQYYENIGDSLNPQFAAPIENPFGLESVYYYAFPTFVDLDGDGDLDLFVGEYDPGLLYFENIGSPNNPQFTDPQENPFGLVSANGMCTTFADLDGDNDSDLLVGEHGGSMQYFENTTVNTIDRLEQKTNLKLFPNPVEDILNIETVEDIERIEIMNVFGEVILSFHGNISNVSLIDIMKGFYVVNFTFSNGNSLVRKVQKI